MAKKIAIPVELKHDFAIRAYISMHKGYLYAIREEYGAAVALKIYEKLCKMDNRIKNLTNTLLNIFKIEGNDAETIANWYDVWWELTKSEGTTLELSKTLWRYTITKCPWKTEYKDIGDWVLIFMNIVAKTINPKTTVERPKGMCAGDSACEYVTKIEE